MSDLAVSQSPSSDAIASYLPTDRRHALVAGVELPVRTAGAALFADISGFTPLTEALVVALGPQRGAEALVSVLTDVWNALVAEVDARRGTVINYAGDAMTCWFDDSGDGGWQHGTVPSAARRASSCGLAIQRAMQHFADFGIENVGRVSLAVKVAVAVGPVVRAVVGNPTLQLVDIQAGETLQRLARAEHAAQQGDVIIDEATVAALGPGETDQVLEWRSDHDTGERFAVIARLTDEVEPDSWPPLPSDAFTNEQLRHWLLPPVADRLFGGSGEFLTELRPAVSMFIRFDGIDYDNDPNGADVLDRFVRALQEVLARYEAYILQITIGDKGSYINTAFGAPLAHGDDVARAVAAAYELRELTVEGISPLQIGISRGRTRTGATGGNTRRCYGVMGDSVNLSARLMMKAEPGEVIAEHSVRAGAGNDFAWEVLPPFQVKGKVQAVRAFRLIGPTDRSNRTIALDAAQPMVGRRPQLALIVDQLELAVRGTGRIVAVTGEAGLGKSRLVAEILRTAAERGITVHMGECQSYGTNASYLVWHDVIRSLFDLDDAKSPQEQRDALLRELGAIDPTLEQRAPLLAPVVNLTIDDNDLTRSFDAELRKTSLESLLVDCIRAKAMNAPIVLVLEDVHWIDPQSHDLLDAIGRAINDVPVLLLLVHRPLSIEQQTAFGLRRLPNYVEVELSVLSDEEIGELALARLSRMYDESSASSDRDSSTTLAVTDLVHELGRRAQGNPFYIEELLNYLAERGLDPFDRRTFESLSLPDSLYSLILGRIDQLTEDRRTALKVASVIGRIFDVGTLRGVHPSLAQRSELSDDLEMLTALDLTLLDEPEPEIRYLFKHAMTHEVAYETIAFAMRAMLHDQVGRHLEERYGELIEQRLDLLAHHFDHSNNAIKRREYLRRAGEAAQATGANVSAVSYFDRVLPLVSGPERVAVLLRLGQVLEVLGEWERSEACNREATELAAAALDRRSHAQAERALGVLARKRGNYDNAITWLRASRSTSLESGDIASQARAVAHIGEIYRLQGRYRDASDHYAESLALSGSSNAEQNDPDLLSAQALALKGAGTVAALEGNYDRAQQLYQQTMDVHQALNDKPGVAAMLNNQGVLARFRQDLASARRLNDESLALLREIGDRWSIGQLLNNQAAVAADQAEFGAARELVEESLTIRRRLGDRSGLALSLNTLADILIDEGRYADARSAIDESLLINRELDDRIAIAYLVEDLGAIAAAEGRHHTAMRRFGFAFGIREANGNQLSPLEADRVARLSAPSRAALPADEAGDSFAIGEAQGRANDLDGFFDLDSSLDSGSDSSTDPGPDR